MLDTETKWQTETEANPNSDSMLKGSRIEEKMQLTFERIEYLNVIMLFLCTGLQNAQNIAS